MSLLLRPGDYFKFRVTFGYYAKMTVVEIAEADSTYQDFIRPQFKNLVECMEEFGDGLRGLAKDMLSRGMLEPHMFVVLEQGLVKATTGLLYPAHKWAMRQKDTKKAQKELLSVLKDYTDTMDCLCECIETSIDSGWEA